MEKEQSNASKIFERVEDITGSLVFVATAATIVLALPAAGAWFAGGMALQTAAGMGLAAKVGLTTLSGVCGAILGASPLIALNMIGKKRCRSYGPIEILCLPSKAATSPFRFARKIARSFNARAERRKNIQAPKPGSNNQELNR